MRVTLTTAWNCLYRVSEMTSRFPTGQRGRRGAGGGGGEGGGGGGGGGAAPKEEAVHTGEPVATRARGSARQRAEGGVG